MKVQLWKRRREQQYVGETTLQLKDKNYSINIKLFCGPPQCLASMYHNKQENDWFVFVFIFLKCEKVSFIPLLGILNKDNKIIVIS